MTTMSEPQGFEQAKDYLPKENYYQKNSEKGYFFGDKNILRDLGIEYGQEVDIATYQSLLQGFHPDSGEKLVVGAGEDRVRCGQDITTSVPKTVSILDEWFRATGDEDKSKELRTAHDEANRYMMEEAKNYLWARVKKENIKAEILYAEFQHDTSRLNVNGTMDMQLHNHNMLFNLGYVDGKYYSILGDNKELFQFKMYLGQIYRNKLASNLKEVGYELVTTDYKEGFFEIKGISRELVETFSGRTKDILAKYEEYQKKFPFIKNEAKLKQIICQTEKIAKAEVDRDALLEENLERMKNAGMNQEMIDSIVNNKNYKNKELTKEENLQQHLEDSIKLVCETESVITKEQLLKEALKYGLENGITKEDYLSVIDNNPNILKFDDNKYTTLDIYTSEREVLDSINDKNFRINKEYGFSEKDIENFIQNSKFNFLNSGQIEMVKEILLNDRQFNLIQGFAGSGKTTAMEFVKEFTKDKNIEIVGLSFTGQASDNLETESGITSHTIHKFLLDEMNRKDDSEVKKGRLIIVDEAGMCSSLQLRQLFEIAKKNNDKIVFTGDKNQFPAVSQGKMFHEMQRVADKVVGLTETNRQKTDHAKEINQKLIEREIDDVFLILEQNNCLIEEPDREIQIKTIANEYVEFNNTNTNPKITSGVIASTNQDVDDLNREIRKLFYKDKNEEHIEFLNRVKTDLIGVAMRYNNHYEEGMIISINKKGIAGFKQGETVKVVGKEGNDCVIVENKSGNRKIFNLNDNYKNFDVYKEKTKQYAKGDVILFTKTMDDKKGFRVRNGQEATIKDIKGNIIELTNGKKFDATKHNFFNYGYARTDISFQGNKRGNMWILANSKINNYNAFYTQLTRIEFNVRLFVDDKAKLLKKVIFNANKTSTIGKELDEKSQIKYEKYTGKISVKPIEKLIEKTEEILEKYVAKIPLKAVKIIENNDIIRRLKKQFKNSNKGKQNEKNSIIRNRQNRISKSDYREIGRRIATKIRDNLRTLSFGKLDSFRDFKMLLSDDAHANLGKINGRKSVDNVRGASESNRRIEKESRRIEVEQIQELEKQQNRNRGR